MFIDAMDDEWENNCKIAQDNLLWYTLYRYEALIPFFHLFREHELLGRNERIGGFPYHCEQVKGAFNPKTLPVNPQDLKYYTLEAVKVVVERPTLLIPPGYEQSMIKALLEIRKQYWIGNKGNTLIIISSLLLALAVLM